MTRIEVDRERCVGSGTCEMLAPDVFEVADDGIVAVLRPEPDGEDAEAAAEAVRACPTQALELADRTTEDPEHGHHLDGWRRPWSSPRAQPATDPP